MARILSVEDDPDIQHLIGQVLFKEGHQMVYAWNGEEGYEKIVSSAPDLVLLDLMLPILNGVELLQKLQQNKRAAHPPIIIISSYKDEANLMDCSVRALGACDYLRKPFQLSELVRSVRSALERFPSVETDRPEEIQKGDLRVQPRLLTLSLGNKVLATLTPKECALLTALMQRAGAVSRAELLEALGYAPEQTDALKQVVHRLRSCMGPEEGRRLRTTAGGYELVG